MSITYYAWIAGSFMRRSDSCRSFDVYVATGIGLVSIPDGRVVEIPTLMPVSGIASHDNE